MTTVDNDLLIATLDRLKLTAIRDQLDSLLDEAARSKMTLREALAFLVSREIARRDERRISMSSKLAQFPFVRELDGFDFEAQPSVDRGQIRELATLPLDRSRRYSIILGATRNRENSSCRQSRSRSDPPKLQCPVRDRSHARRHVSKGPQRRNPRQAIDDPVTTETAHHR